MKKIVSEIKKNLKRLISVLQVFNTTTLLEFYAELKAN